MYCLIVSHHLQSLLSSSNWYLILRTIQGDSGILLEILPAVSPDIYHHAFIWTSVIFLGVLRLMHQIPALWSTGSFLTIHLIIFLTALKNFFNCLPSSSFYLFISLSSTTWFITFSSTLSSYISILIAIPGISIPRYFWPIIAILYCLWYSRNLSPYLVLSKKDGLHTSLPTAPYLTPGLTPPPLPLPLTPPCLCLPPNLCLYWGAESTSRGHSRTSVTTLILRQTTGLPMCGDTLYNCLGLGCHPQHMQIHTIYFHTHIPTYLFTTNC